MDTSAHPHSPSEKTTTISFQREEVPLEAEESAQDLPLQADSIALRLGLGD